MTVQMTAQPDLFYDYSGFPPETYQLHWPAKGDPQLASQIRDLLKARGIQCATNGERGYDHGVFVPLLLVFPDPGKVPGQSDLMKSELDHFFGNRLAVCSDRGSGLFSSQCMT